MLHGTVGSNLEVREGRGMKPLGAADPTVVASYRLLGVLGSGGMGRVYLGRSPTGRRLAIKVIRADLAEDQSFRRRFAREVDAVRAVSPLFTAGGGGRGHRGGGTVAGDHLH